MNVIKYDIKKVIERNRFCGMARYPFDNDPCAPYYSDRGSSCYDMFLLGHLLGHLRIENQNPEFIMHELQTKKFISVANDLEYLAGRYNPQTNILRIGGKYADFMDQAYFESCFPEEKSKDFLEYEYPISLDNFLELAEKMKKFFDDRVEWIILYEDEMDLFECLKKAAPYFFQEVLYAQGKQNLASTDQLQQYFAAYYLG